MEGIAHTMSAREWELPRSIVKKVGAEYPSADGLVAANAIEAFGPERFGLNADEVAFCESRGVIKQEV